MDSRDDERRLCRGTVRNKIFENLWGWQVTVPDAVDSAKWNELYETYVLDKNGLNIKDLFRQAKNMYAYQALVARMLETIRKSYWKPAEKVKETLAREYAQSAEEVGLACCDHTCNNPQLTAFTSKILVSVPGSKNVVKNFGTALDVIKNTDRKSDQVSEKHDSINSEKTPDDKVKKVEGYEMQEVGKSGASSAPIPYVFLFGFLACIGLFMLGFNRG